MEITDSNHLSNVNDVNHMSLLKNKVTEIINRIRDSKKRPDLNSIYDQFMRTGASNINKEYIESIIMELLIEGRIINKKTTKGQDSFYIISNNKVMDRHVRPSLENLFEDDDDSEESNHSDDDENENENVTLEKADDIENTLSFISCAYKEAQYNTLKENLLNDIEKDIASIIDDKMMIIKNKDTRQTNGINNKNCDYVSDDINLLKDQLKSKDMIINILYDQLKTLQNITENLSTARIHSDKSFDYERYMAAPNLNQSQDKSKTSQKKSDNKFEVVKNKNRNKNKEHSKNEKMSITLNNRFIALQSENEPTDDPDFQKKSPNKITKKTTTSMGKKRKEQHSKKQENKRQNEKSKEKRLAIIIGDSMIKKIKPWEMSKKLKDTNVVTRRFDAARYEDMLDYIKPSKRREANIYLLHTGTNELQNKDKEPEDIANSPVEFIQK